MNTEINCVKDYLCNNKTRFGILDNVPETEYLNITAQNIRFIATKQIRTSIPLPSVNGILNNCRGIINYPGVIDTSYASFRVTDAHEELVHCDTDKPGVRVTINGQIVVRSVPEKEGCPPNIPMFDQVYDLTKPIYLIINEFNLLEHVNSIKKIHPDWSSYQLYNQRNLALQR